MVPIKTNGGDDKIEDDIVFLDAPIKISNAVAKLTINA